MGSRALLEKSMQVQKSLKSIGVDSVIETKKDFIELNIDQLKHGKKADGTQIGRYSKSKQWKWYAEKKHAQNPLAGFGNKDLIHEEDFINGLDINKHGGDGIEAFSHDEKYNLLTAQYGENILGLQEDNTPVYRRKAFIPTVRKKVSAIYNG